MLTDRPTLERFRNGDPVVLTALYRAHAPDIARMARAGFSFTSKNEGHRFHGFHDVSDQQNLIQETFVRAFSPQARASYDGLSPYEGYLRGIARNVVIDLFRSRERALAVFDVELAERQPSDAPPADALVDKARLTALVRTFVDALPRHERTLVAHRFEQGLTQEETADRMKVGRSRVRTLEARVREKLEKALHARGERPPGTALASIFLLAVPS